MAALLSTAMTATAQTAISFETEDYRSIGVYDQWVGSPFTLGTLQGHAGVADNPSKEVDLVLGAAPNTTDKVVAVQRSRHAGNVFGVRIDLKEPLRMTKELKYIHVMAYLKDKPADSRMMVIGLGKRVESSWSWQTGEDEQFWAMTTAPVSPKAGWQDVVMSFKGFSYSREENAKSGIDIHALVIIPDLRSPHADPTDWVAYFDEIVVDNNPAKRFSTEMYAVDFNRDTAPIRSDRSLQAVGLTVDGKAQTASLSGKRVYYNNVAEAVFSAKAGQSVKPTFKYLGAWMNAFVYADWGNDAVFSYGINDDGTPLEGTDIVSYNAVEHNGAWRKSDGTTVSNGNNIAAGVPKFTVPADAKTGFYRMRYRVDWAGLTPAGSSTIISDGGALVDVTMDVHGETVSVSASQLNGDIVLAEDLTPLQNYQTTYAQSLKVKVIPEKGFVQNGFTLKYGYNVNAVEQLNEYGNPNWILVNVPAKDIAADSTYTIPAEYIRGGYVSIAGDMQQVRQYTVRVEGAPEGQGGVLYTGVEYGDKATIDASQHFSVEDVEAIPVEGYILTSIVLDSESGVITVTYKAVLAYRQINSLSELSNSMAYHIKAQSGEGYYAWNTSITDTYVSLRGLTNSSHNNLPSNNSVVQIYKEEVSPFDSTVVWQILKDGDGYYLYQPANDCYVTRNNRDYVFTDEKTPLDNIRDNGDGTFSFHAGGGYSDDSKYFACICTNEAQYPVRNWTWSDHGSKMFIIENPNIEVDDITVGIDEIHSTYKEDNVIYNLNGQKLSALPRSGIVIVNRKKVLVR